jgi:hypothetical protein
MIVELLSVVAVFAGGCLAVRIAGLTGWPVPAFGLVAGVCLQLTVGLVQVVTPLPTSPMLTLVFTAGLPAAGWLVRWRQGHDVTLPVRYSALSLLVLAAVVAVVRPANLVKWHIDSLKYVMTGSLLADGTYYRAEPTNDVVTRLIGLPLLHAPAQLAGEDYLRSITLLLAAATLAILVWFFRQGMRDRLDRRQLVTFAALGALLLVTGNRFVFSAFYINGHLLVAMLLLTIAGCGWLLAGDGDQPVRALMTLQVLAIPALVVARPEGAVLAGLALFPTLLSGRVPVRHRAAATAVLGVTIVVWQGFVLWVHLDRGIGVPLNVAGMLGLGGLVVAAAGLLRLWQLPDRIRWLVVAEAGLWLALAAFTVRAPDILADSVRATIQNVVFGAGRWGASLVVLGALVAGALLFAGFPGQASLRFPVTTFLPLGFLLAYLREEGAYRANYTDSLSRMFMHVVPLAVLYVTVAYSQRRRETSDDRGPAGRGDARGRHRQPHEEVHGEQPGDPLADHAMGRPA